MTNAVSIAQQGSNNTTFRNRIINGAMTINQRGFSGSNSNNTYTLDRWIIKSGLDNKFTLSQSSTAPSNFINSILITSSSSYSVPSNEFYSIGQRIEGFNLYDIGFGTSACKSTALSFWVRSSLTGTFGGALTNAAGDASYAFTYTISSANTWTQISISVPPVTTGTWVTDNSNCLQVWFGLGVGSSYSGTPNTWVNGNNFSATGATSVVGTSGATFYITGVQLEAGSAASPFENRLYGTEFALCQRYYWKKIGVNGSGNTMVGAGMFYNNTDPRCCLANPVVMRTTPAITFSGSGFSSERAGTFAGTIGTPTSANLSPEASLLYSGGTGTTAGTQGQGTFWYINDSTSYIAVSAEL